MTTTPTPRTDAVVKMRDISGERSDVYKWYRYVDYDFARQLERELAEAQRERDQWRACATLLRKTMTEYGYNAKEGHALAAFDKLNTLSPTHA